ncbi:MAG: hypothetical protein M1827_005454 [Pycnora praestabilis]|nr:MAG: hypothetical protein M1827_005454 [Pycnora praestabilis]
MTSTETYRPAFPDRDYPHISYGLPFPEACAKHVTSTFNASRVYIISSGSLAKNTEALISLQKAMGDRVVGTRIGMKPHTLWSEVLEIVKEAKQANADLLITLGAGSLTDASKIISLALANSVSTFSDLASLAAASQKQANSGDRQSINAPTVSIISIPTSLSGGEYSDFAGGTNDETHHKQSFSDPVKGPQIIILDAALTSTTPASVWLSTGIRSVDHCVETLCSLKSNPESDDDAERGLRMLAPGLLRCKHDKEDLEARHHCQMGVIEAMKAVGKGVPMGGSHAIGHQLGPLGVGHGETSCILLPAVCKYNIKANGERQKKVLQILWSDKEVKTVLQRRGLKEEQADLGDLLDAVIAELGMPRSLRAVGVGKDKLDKLAENSLKDPWTATNPIPLKEKGQIMNILEMAAT